MTDDLGVIGECCTAETDCEEYITMEDWGPGSFDFLFYCSLHAQERCTR